MSDFLSADRTNAAFECVSRISDDMSAANLTIPQVHAFFDALIDAGLVFHSDECTCDVLDECDCNVDGPAWRIKTGDEEDKEVARTLVAIRYYP